MNFSTMPHYIIEHLPSFLLSLLGIGAVMAVHEYGHFIFGKLFNVCMTDFSIGFGPKMLKKKCGETTYSLSLIPMGAYVGFSNDPQIAGNNRTLKTKKYWQKMCIVSGGILFNLIFAYIIFLGLSMTGMPANSFLSKNSRYCIQNIAPESCAAKAGLQVNDRIIELNNVKVDSSTSLLLDTLAPLAHQTIPVIIERNGAQQSLQITLDGKTNGSTERGFLGVGFSYDPIAPTSFIDAIPQAFTMVTSIATGTVLALKNAIVKKSAHEFSGPLMALAQTAHGAKQGIKIFLIVLAFISVGLAVLNVLPLPVLDGGNALMYTIEAIIRRPINEHVQNIIYITGALFLGLFFLYITFKDVILLFFK